MDANTRVSKYKHTLPKNNPKAVVKSIAVTGAEWIKDYVINVLFNDGTQQVVDFGPYFNGQDHPLIRPYKDPDRFKTFYIDMGNLVWGEHWDMTFPNWKLYRGYIVK